MTNLPPIFVISLDRSVGRRTEVIAHLRERGIVDYKIFSAFDGEAIGVTTKNPYLRDWNDWAPPYGIGPRPPFFVGAGVNGLMLSYIALAKTCLMLGYEEAIILEDDVVLCDNFTDKYAEFRSQLPRGFLYAHLGSAERYCSQLMQVSPMIAIGYACCTEAMLYSRKALEVISERGKLWGPYDAFLIDFVAQGRAHIAHPAKLARQHSADGDAGWDTTLS